MSEQDDKMQAGFMAIVNYRLDHMMNRHKDKLESPIEAMFLRAFFLYSLGHTHQAIVIDAASPLDTDTMRVQGLGPHEIIRPQYQIGDYRVDFCLESAAGGRLVLCVIECDGHDYHERTKEQAAKDRKRDRDLQGAGYLVFRFTGSQIYRDPWGCIDEMYAAICATAERRDLEEWDRK